MLENTDDDGIFSDAQEEGEVSKRTVRHEHGLATDVFYERIRADAERAAKVKKRSDDEEEQEQLIRQFPILGESVNALRLSASTVNRLEEEGIVTVYDLLRQTRERLLEIRNFGPRALKEIVETLADHDELQRMRKTLSL